MKAGTFPSVLLLLGISAIASSGQSDRGTRPNEMVQLVIVYTFVSFRTKEQPL